MLLESSKWKFKEIYKICSRRFSRAQFGALFSTRFFKLVRCYFCACYYLRIWPRGDKNLWKCENMDISSLKWPVGNYMLKVNIRNTRTRCEICSKLTIKTPERHWHHSGVFIVNFEHISHLVSTVNFE